MSNISKERLEKVIAYFNKRGYNQTLIKYQLIPDSLSRYLRKAKKLGMNVNHPAQKSPSQQAVKLTQKGNTMFIDSPVAHDIKELMENFNIDQDYWDITKTIINEWGSVDNFNRQCKAWLQAKGDIIDWNTFKKEFLEDVKKLSPVIRYKHTNLVGKAMQEINIFDLHLGKLGWKPESGENYDNKIAKDRFEKALVALIEYGQRFCTIDQYLFPVGNDLFNSDKDYPYPQTTAGTPQENDLRWQKSFRMGRQMICWAIDLLGQMAPVHVVVIPGNHEVQKSFYLGDLLEVKYENNKNIIIDNNPCPRKYYQYYKNMIGFSHGRETDVPEARLIQLMPQEQPRMWADTLFREWHLGDIHHKKVIKLRNEEDHTGIVLRYMRTLMGQDSWETWKGLKATRGAETYIWDKNLGMIANFNYNVVN